MPSKKSLSYINTEEADENKQQPELLQNGFRNVQCSNNIENNDTEELKRKIDTINRYQKP